MAHVERLLGHPVCACDGGYATSQRRQRVAIDYGDLEQWMAHAEQVIRDTRRRLGVIAAGGNGGPDRTAVPTQGDPTEGGVEL